MGFFQTLADGWRIKQQTIRDILRSNINPFDLLSNDGKVQPFNKSKAIDYYKDWAYTCATRNAMAVAKAVLKLYSTRATGEQGAGERWGRKIGKPISKAQYRYLSKIKSVTQSPQFKQAAEIEEIIEHPAITLLQTMNSFHNEYDYFSMLSLFMDITGDCFWFIQKQSVAGNSLPQEIWTLPSQQVTIVPDEKDFIKGYLYGNNLTKIKLLPDEVIHFKRPNIKDMWYGMSRVEGAWNAVFGMDSMEKYETAHTENHGIQEMIINYKGGSLSPEKRKELMRSWSQAFKFASINHSALITDQEIDIKPAAWPPREIAFLQGRQWRQKEIVNAFGQPLALYEKDANRANIEGAIYLWEEFEITSTLRLIEQKLNEKLLPMYGEDRLFFAFDSVVADNPEEIRANATALLPYGYPLNRALEDMGKDPVEGGDIGTIRGTLPLSNTQENNQILENINSSNEKQAGKSIDSYVYSGGSHFLTKRKRGSVEVISGGSNPSMTPKEKELAEAVKRAWRPQMQLALAEVPKLAAASFSWLSDEKQAEEIYKLTHGLLGEFIEIGGYRGARQIGVNVIDFIKRPHVQSAIKDYSFKFARTINQTTADKLKKELAKGLELGESISELTKRIEGLWTGGIGVDGEFHPGWDDWRAERIARTESAKALCRGQEMQWKESGVVSRKVFSANDDACPFCLALDGKAVELGGEFIPQGHTQTTDFEGEQIELSHDYESVEGGDAHPNCRCGLIAELIKI